MEACVFCKIARGEVGAEKILETDRAISFLDINPRALGHSLVIPKKHLERLTDLDDELVADVFKATKRVMRVLEKVLKPDAFTSGINDGEAAGQVIKHVHVNIIPRFRGDGGGPIHSVVHRPPTERVSETAERIRKAQE